MQRVAGGLDVSTSGVALLEEGALGMMERPASFPLSFLSNKTRSRSGVWSQLFRLCCSHLPPRAPFGTVVGADRSNLMARAC